MAKPSNRFLFDFILGECVTLECVAIFRGKACTAVAASFQGKVFDVDGIVIDWDDEYLPMAEALCHYAEQSRDTE